MAKNKQGRVIDRKKFARALESGMTLGESMIAAGYAPTSAKKGKAALKKECFTTLEVMLKKNGGQLETISRNAPDERLRHIVRGRLTKNTIEGKDGGVQSAKLLGSLRELNMFQAESGTNFVIIVPPAGGIPSFVDFPAVDQNGNVIEGQTCADAFLPAQCEAKR